jgi:hypothetical protein
MDFYNLNAFNEITVGKLIAEFKNGNTIKTGGILVYSGSFGKPGDTIFGLTKILKISKGLEFDFGRTKIQVYKPEFIINNEKVIGIKKSENIKWILDGQPIGETMLSNHSTSSNLFDILFKCDKESNAFVFYAW